ncbi:methenyltetrahydromethanopterin cyclohydrolase, partial [Mesorhizobium sp. M7A.F.Ca.US.006.01.1.1]|uniref:methenyltetrahydromethanopterin cyclohydrolase n=1 Tax=Mesorhizobium sp. M7A.F.Ca.US.006.01.1.1 TaxID=2496707 RepID=UPI000FD1A703
RDYGQPFAEIFTRFKGDFYAIDPLLFSPAEVIVTAIETGDTFRAGQRDPKMLERSLG